ncbi:DUF3108 domain-containing protein [Limnohabitans sp.]|uniref:DUF3108 domain-containing protein n=1 Tax=Limnohabitans sp. TaxID=1907725 RepID=UPI00333EA7C1
MSMLAATPAQPPRPVSGPAPGALWSWILVVLGLHLAVGMAMVGARLWQIQGPQSLRVGPVQTRWLPPAPSPPATVQQPKAKQERQTRLATEPSVPTPRPASAAAPPPEPDDARVATEPMTEPSSPPTLLGESDQADRTQAAAEAKLAATNDVHSATLASADKPAALPATPTGLAEVNMALPQLGLAALPTSALLNYRLSGQEKGIPYQATGELRWQRNAGAYAMGLSVRAFLLGTRVWRSQGLITAQGLAPVRFSDSWRSERATHFDGEQNRIVFSSNAPSVPLQPGAQDQISLYPQMAALMAQEGGRLQPGARLQVQTATVRDALPWLLTLEQEETLQVDGQNLQATKWVCQPRNRFDAKVEFWVAAKHEWLPVRIRITQVSGSFIDLLLTGRAGLPDLP